MPLVYDMCIWWNEHVTRIFLFTPVSRTDPSYSFIHTSLLHITLVMYNPASTKAALSIHVFSKRWQLTYQSCVTTINALARPPNNNNNNNNNKHKNDNTYTQKNLQSNNRLQTSVIPGPMCKYEPMGTSEMSNWDLTISTCFLKLMKGGATASVCIIRCTWTFPWDRTFWNANSEILVCHIYAIP